MRDPMLTLIRVCYCSALLVDVTVAALNLHVIVIIPSLVL